jgi:hypothetical protein
MLRPTSRPDPCPSAPQSDDHPAPERSDHQEVIPDQTSRIGWAVAPIPARNRATAPDPQEAPVGPTRTVPPDPPATPRTPRHLVNDPLELDRPPAAPPEPATPTKQEPLPAAHPDGTREQRDLAADLLTPEPLSHRADVLDSRLQPPEPPGRRTPEPLDAAREGVER